MGTFAIASRLAGAALLLVLAACGRESPPEPAETASAGEVPVRPADPVLGPPDAAVTLIEAFDFA